MGKMTEREYRTLGAVHSKRGLVKLSNFDNPEKRVEKLKAAGLVSADGVLTAAGCEHLRAYYIAQGWPEMAARVPTPTAQE